MSGIAAIKTPSHDDIQVFYTTTKSNLGLDIRKAIHSNNNPTKGYIATSTDPDGNVVTSSDIAVSSYLGIQFVVGITRNPAGTTGAPSGTTLNNISILSPISQTIARVEQDNSRITSCSNGIQSSVFYLRKHPHDPEGSHLWEYDFDSGQAKHVDDLANVRKGSGLASYYTKDDRLVVYQDKKGVIREYSSKTTDNSSIQPVKNSLALTSLAVTHDSELNKSYLYYCDTGNNVNFAVKAQGSWGESSRLPNSLRLPTGNSLTVVRSGDVNHIFWVTAESNVDHRRHPIS